MQQINTVSLIGLGALGCAYLHKITQVIPADNIRVIAAGERAERYRQDGVVINGSTCRFPIVEPGQTSAPADLLIFTVKHHHLKQAIQDVRGHVGPNTVIISLLNGISSEQEIAAVYGMDKVLYSLSLGIDATRTDSGTTYSTTGRIPFGDAKNVPNQYSKNVLRLKEFLDRVEVENLVPEDMMISLWNKFMLNVGTNQVSAILRSPYFAFQTIDRVRELSLEAMREVVAVATKQGIALPSSAPEDALKILETLSPTGKTSMLQDIEAGRKTEVEIFGGTVIDLGHKYGVPVPVNEMLVRLILSQEEVAAHTKKHLV